MPGIPHHGLMPSLYPTVTLTSPRPLHTYPPPCQTQRAESEVDVGVVMGMQTLIHTPQMHRAGPPNFATSLVGKVRQLACEKENSCAQAETEAA